LFTDNAQQNILQKCSDNGTESGTKQFTKSSQSKYLEHCQNALKCGDRVKGCPSKKKKQSDESKEIRGKSRCGKIETNGAKI